MKKCILLLAALGLLLCGCGAESPATVISSTTALVSTATTTTAATTTVTTTAAPSLSQEGTLWCWQGEWHSLLTPATEKEEQVTAYDILKKLRHKEAELGFLFSGTLVGHLPMGDTDYLLCEIGHWRTDAEGGVSEYEMVTYLMVPADLSAAYEAVAEEDALRWDTAQNWFR